MKFIHGEITWAIFANFCIEFHTIALSQDSFNTKCMLYHNSIQAALRTGVQALTNKLSITFS